MDSLSLDVKNTELPKKGWKPEKNKNGFTKVFDKSKLVLTDTQYM